MSVSGCRRSTRVSCSVDVCLCQAADGPHVFQRPSHARLQQPRQAAGAAARRHQLHERVRHAVMVPAGRGMGGGGGGVGEGGDAVG